MSNFRRRLMMSIKKENYTELEYLESTGTQYIDTCYIPTINTDIKTKASIKFNNTSLPVALFGYLSGNNPYNRYSIQYQKNTVYVSKGKTETRDTTIDYTKMCEIETQGSNYIYDEKIISVAPLDFSVSSNLSIILFARQTVNVNRNSSAKIKYFQIYENNILVRDMIPVLDKDNIACMYDKVNSKFYYNERNRRFLIRRKGELIC